METIPRHPQTWFDETNWVFFANERDSPIREEKHPGDHCPRQYLSIHTKLFPRRCCAAQPSPFSVPVGDTPWNWWFIPKAFPSGSGSKLWHPNFFTRKLLGFADASPQKPSPLTYHKWVRVKPSPNGCCLWHCVNPTLFILIVPILLTNT